MSARPLLQCLQQPLFNSLWPGAAAPFLARAAAGHLDAAAASSSGLLLSSHPGNWRGLAADASSTTLPAADEVPWSSGVASSSSTSSSQRQAGVPEPLVLRPGMYSGSFRLPPKSLQYNRGEVVYLPQLESSVVGRGLLWALGAYSTKQQLRNGASVMYQGITEAAENTELQQAVGLEVGSFMAPFNLLSLHMWLIINRLNAEPESKESKLFLDALYIDYFVKDIERRVYKHGVQIRVSKWVETLTKQFYGTGYAYDKAIRLTEGGAQAQEAALVAALVKNMYNADSANKPWAELLARYLIRELRSLDQTDVEAIYKGHIRFSTDIVKQ